MSTTDVETLKFFLITLCPNGPQEQRCVHVKVIFYEKILITSVRSYVSYNYSFDKLFLQMTFIRGEENLD